MFDNDACAPAAARDLAGRLLAWAEQLAGDHGPATKLVEDEREDLVLGLATIIKVIRLGRNVAYGGVNLGDPAWQVMLDLLVHEMEGRRASIEGLARSGSLAIATVAESVQTLEDLGLAVLTPEKFDGRFIWAGLSQRARSTLFDLLLQAGEFVRPRGFGLPL